MGVININAYITNKSFHVNPISVQINCDKGQYQVLGYGLFVLVPGAIPNKKGGYYAPGDSIPYEATIGHENQFKKLINIQYQRSNYWFDTNEESIREACRSESGSTAGFTTIKDNGNGTFTATMPNGTAVTWSSSTGKGFDGVVDLYSNLPDPTQHKDEVWYVINTTLPGALGNLWRSDGNNWISSLTLLKTKGDLLTFSTEQTVFPLGTNGYALTVDTTTPTGFKYVPFTPLPVSLGTANQILGMNNAGTALEYKTVSTSGIAVLNDVGVTLTTANALIINLPSATAAIRGVLTSADWSTFNSKLTSTLSNTKIFIGSAGNIATEQTLSLNATGGTFGLAASGILTMPNADTSTRGLLTSTDWNTFNNKQAAGNYITALTGDVTASGPGSVAATLATVNANVGSFTYASITVNAKGLITAASTGTNPSGVYLPLAGGTMVGAILFSTDNTIDVGALNATRPRTVHVGTSVMSPLIIGGTAVGSTIGVQGTTGNGTLTASAINFLVGNNGATTAGTILNNGKWVFGNSTTAQATYLTINFSPSTLDAFAFRNTATSASMFISSNPSTIGSEAAGSWAMQASAKAIYFDTSGSSTVTKILILTAAGNLGIGAVPGTRDRVLIGGSPTPTGGTASAIRVETTLTATANNNDLYGLLLNNTYSSGAFTGVNLWGLYQTSTTTVNFFGGKVQIGGAGSVMTATTALLHLAAGTATASTAPLKFTSGTLLTAGEAGAIEFLTDKYYATITTGTARKEITLNDAALTPGVIPIATTNGRLTDSAFSTTTLLGGNYTPTSTNVTNITSSTPKNATYKRVGNIVTVFGSVTITNTLAVASQLDLSLPVASNLGATTDLNGVGQSDVTLATNVIIIGDVTNDRASMFFTAVGVGGTGTIFYSYQYRVI